MNKELLVILNEISKEENYNICLGSFNNLKCGEIRCPYCILSGPTEYIQSIQYVIGNIYECRINIHT